MSLIDLYIQSSILFDVLKMLLHSSKRNANMKNINVNDITIVTAYNAIAHGRR